MTINRTKIQVLLLCFLSLSCAMQAQNMISMSSLHPVADTINAGIKELAIRYPGLRKFGVSFSGFGYSDFDAKLDDRDFASGKIKTERISTFFNTPAIKWKVNSLSAGIYYAYTSTMLKDISNKLPEAQLTSLTSDKSTFDLSLNYARSGRIFNHPVVYSLVVRGITDGVNSFRRLNLNGSINLPLKKTENTTFSVGLLGLIDPSSPIPVEPIVNYYHKFIPSGLELIVDLPTGINLKKEIAKNAWVSIGSNQRSYTIFYDRHNAFLDGKVSYNTIELKSGVAFELLFMKSIMLTLDGGLNSFLSAKLFKEGENYNKASIMSSNKSAPYVNIGLSLVSF